jgi:hypothetical protein
VDVAASGDLAHAVGTYELSYEDAGGTAIRDTGKFLDVFRKPADGRWQQTVVMFSSDLPAGGVSAGGSRGPGNARSGKRPYDSERPLAASEEVRLSVRDE